MQQLPTIEVNGKVAVKPILQAHSDGRMFAKVLLEVNSVSIDGQPCTSANDKRHAVVFQDAKAQEAVKALDRGTTIGVRGDLITIAWSQDGQRFTSNEIRNASFNVLEQAVQVRPPMTRHGGLSR